MTFLFFIWGFLTEMDGALIPFLKDLFALSNFQAALVQFAFFLAFFLFSFPSARILDRLGYRKGIALGLLIMACGSFGFIAAGYFGQYAWFLVAIFSLAGGVTILQVAANPYMVALGGEDKGSNYLNIAQGFNAGAKVLAPLFGAWAILKGMEVLSSEARIERISWVYLGIGLVLALAALLYRIVKLPEVVPTEDQEEEESHHSYRDFPHLLRGAFAIFCYVGVEVSIATFLVLYLGEAQGLSRADGALFLSYYWAALMLGRLLIPFLLPKVAAQKVLFWFALAAGLAILFAGLGNSWGAWALVACGFFHSIMWGNIFALSLRKLGTFTSKGSGLLVMAIVGGALIPPLQGLVADQIGLATSYLSLLPAYAYLLWFAWKGFRPKHIDL
jgi:FHS family L-fucose permease-like MFS transporter